MATTDENRLLRRIAPTAFRHIHFLLRYTVPYGSITILVHFQILTASLTTLTSMESSIIYRTSHQLVKFYNHGMSFRKNRDREIKLPESCPMSCPDPCHIFRGSLRRLISQSAKFTVSFGADLISDSGPGPRFKSRFIVSANSSPISTQKDLILLS